MKNTCLRRMLLLMMAALCLIPAMALAMPEILFVTEGDEYSWDETKNLLTVTGGNVYADTSADNAAFDINVQSGSLHVIGHVVGDVTVKNGYLSIIHDNYDVNLAALTGGLFVEGGEVYIRGCSSHGEGTATAGVRLTKNSTIIGGKVWIAGGNDMDDGSLALTRDGSVTLSVSEEAWLRLSGGVLIVEDELVTFRPDYNGQTSPALDEANLNMLVWESPVQMKAKNYKKVEDVVDEFEKAVFQDEATVYKPGDMKGKNVIESFKGWVVSYDANGGTGSMEGAIVPDGVPYTIATDCGFTAPAGHSFAYSWLVNDDTMKEFSFPVTADVTIKPVWKVNQYTLKFVDEDGKEMDSITADYGAPITIAPSIPEKEGYTFIGWDSEIPATMPAANLTITAVWKQASTGGAGGATMEIDPESLPQTGDPSSLLVWAALLGTSGIGAKALRRRKK